MVDDSKKVNSFFIEVINNIDSILNNNFYEDKGELKEVSNRIKKWYNSFKKTKSLKNIDVSDLDYIDLEISTIFDQYITTESIEENYVERLLYNFGQLEKEWKKEMLGEK